MVLPRHRVDLSETGLGRSILQYPAESVIFAQGDPADAVFYLQKGRAKLTASRGGGV